MGVIRKFKALFHDNWCPTCTKEMDLEKKELYMLPMIVGHYVSHQNADYYKRNLIKVTKKADIPTGQYACGMYVYKCKNCNKKVVKLSIFLPVRDVEKYEDTIFFNNGELNSFINQIN